MRIGNVSVVIVYTLKVCLFSVMLLPFHTPNIWAKDVFKIAANSHYVSGHWEELLKASLDITREEFGPYEIVIHSHGMGNERHLKEMIKGELVNTRVGITTPAREDAFIPIKIPIRKGLLNYRLLLTNKSDLHKFEGVETLEQLKKLKAGLVDRWITSDVLDHHNFNLFRIEDYDSFFRMLQAKRYDYTVRGVNEIYAEIDFKQPQGAEFAVIPNIGLYINSPTYFFISKRHPKLATRLEVGLEMLLKTGQFDRIFYKWHQKSIDKANIKERVFINVGNPFLPVNTPIERPELWFKPSAD